MALMAGAAAALFLLLAAVPAFATDYTVGDTNGWTSGADYSTWATGKTFVVGDTLLFQYSMLHSVNEVGKSDYEACSASNSIQSYSDQNTKITLSAPGTRYFVCGTPSHCSSGMKLSVDVSGSNVDSPPSSSTLLTPEAGSTSAPPAPFSGPNTPYVPTRPSSTPTLSNTKIHSAAESRFGGWSAVLVGLLAAGAAAAAVA